jgi:hypothetical protein
MNWFFAVAIAILAATSPAWAQDVPPEPQSEKPAVARAQQATAPETAKDATAPVMEHRWYGWQTLLADGTSASVVAAGGAGNSTAVVLAGAASYVLAAPIVHGAHGKGWQAVLSLGLRVGLPVAGFQIGAASASCPNGEFFCGLEEGAIGGLVGVLGASVIDAALLAYEEVPVTVPPPARAAAFRWTPTIALDQKRVGVGLQGTF